MSKDEAILTASNKSTPGKATWILLIIAWVLFIVPLPGLGWIGWALNLVAFILSIVALSQAGVRAGLWQLLASLIVSPIIYSLIGIPLMAALITHGMAHQ